MSNLTQEISKLKSQYGDRMQIVTDGNGVSSIVIKEVTELVMNKARFAEKELRELPAGMGTRIIPVKGTTRVLSMPASGVQALGITKAGAIQSATLLDMNKALTIEHHNYVTIVDSKTAPKNAEAIINELFGSKEAFQKTAFLTFETLNPAIVLSPGEQIRLQTLTEKSEQLKFLQSKMKWEYPIILGADGNPQRDASGRIMRNREGELVLSRFNGAPIYRGTLFINDLTTKVGETELSAFKNYRVGLDAETDEKVFEEGTFAQLGRVATALTNLEQLAVTASTTNFITAGIVSNSIQSGAKPVEHDALEGISDEDLRAKVLLVNPALESAIGTFSRAQLSAMLQ